MARDGELVLIAGEASAVAVSLVEQARDYAERSTSANTRRAYASDLADFKAWCVAANLCPLPTDEPTLALYLTARAADLTVSTLERRLAAIRSAHKLAGWPSPAGANFDRVWSGIRRTHGCPPQKKRAFMSDDLRRAVLALPGSTSGLRDRALLLVGFGAALRRSELAALHVDGSGAPVVARFVSGGLEVHLQRSKADQEGHGAVVAIPESPRPETCAVKALRAWLDHASIPSGPIFRPVSRWGCVGAEAMSTNAVALVVKRTAEALGLDPDGFGGHSLRAGLATSAAANDAPAESIMRQMRHASFDTTQGYIRTADRFKRNAAAMTGL